MLSEFAIAFGDRLVRPGDLNGVVGPLLLLRAGERVRQNQVVFA
ncbi:hypothetical protein [Nocardiopsis kunsanensis]|nr:hypothetical protein [Nocardiopsis kunsanensis]